MIFILYLPDVHGRGKVSHNNKDNPEERGVDLPDSVVISEEGPREGFQIEPGPIATADKIALIDALSACGLRRIQVASFVNPKHVPGWADTEAVMAGFSAREGVEYSAVWFNEAGMQRALAFRGKLTLAGFISLSASEPFAIKNLNRDRVGQIEAMRQICARARASRRADCQDHRDGRLRLQFCRRHLAGKSHRDDCGRARHRARSRRGRARRHARRLHGLGHAEACRGRHWRRSGTLGRSADRASSPRHARAGHRLRL